MKKLKIKNLVLAAALAVGLGVTGIAATAQAAEGKAITEADCEHLIEYWKDEISYDTRDNNRFTHTKYIMHLFKCEICGYIPAEYAVVEEVQEPHELVYNYVENKYECAHCDYWE